MGNDLYWKKTPKPEEEEFTGLSMSTWYFLAELWGEDEVNNLDGKELEKIDLSTLNTVYKTAKHTGDKDLMEDALSLINGIKKYGSITLNVRG